AGCGRCPARAHRKGAGLARDGAAAGSGGDAVTVPPADLVAAPDAPRTPGLRATRMRLHAQHQAIALMRVDCHVCRAEGLAARSHVLVEAHGRQVQAALYQVEDGPLQTDQVALSEAAWQALGVREGDPVEV